MPRYSCTIDVLIEANNETEACDGLSEALRPLMKPYADNPANTCLVDWMYSTSAGGMELDNGTDFEHGDWK